MNSLVKPDFLEKGDLVAITSMAYAVEPQTIDKAKSQLESWGLKVEVMPSALQKHHLFAGTDQERSQDLQKAFNNPEIKAIFSARGGYGATKIIDLIDFKHFAQHPKWVIGFSDITAVHTAINHHGFCSLHGPMPKTFSFNEESVTQLRDILFGKAINYTFKPNPYNVLGEASGITTGGNLCLIAHNIGSKYDIPFDNKILFLEDVSEQAYNIDRMMVQLKRASKLNNLAALVVGDFSETKGEASFGKTAYEIIAEHTKEYNYPVAFGFEFGHDTINYPIIMGEVLLINVNEKSSDLSSVDDSLLLMLFDE